MKELSKLSSAELRNLDVQVQDALKTHHYLAISKAREQILHIVQSAGLTVDDILASKVPKRTKLNSVAAKYQNPNDTKQTWNGRGRRPLWVKEYLLSGKSMGSLSNDAKHN